MRFLNEFICVICMLSDLGQAKEAPEYRNVRFGPRQDESIERVMLPNLSFKKCLKQCALRASCEVMGYLRAALLCELHFIRDFWNTLACNENGPLVMAYVQRSDILLKDAETCKFCDISTQTCDHCVTNECPPYAKVPYGTILGNLHCDGTKRLMKCDNGYAPKNRTNVQSWCKDRQWTKITQCVPEECILNQDTFGRSTYTFAIKSRRDYNDSVAFCQHCGYRVVAIESAVEQEYLANKMRGFFPNTQEKNGFFLDFYKKGDKIFRMDNHSEVRFEQWGTDEPDGEDEKFIIVYGGDQWKWHDIVSTREFQTVCEIET